MKTREEILKILADRKPEIEKIKVKKLAYTVSLQKMDFLKDEKSIDAVI